MITLYGFGSALGLVDLSPFVVKTDVMLRLAGLPYQLKADPGYMAKAPKKKVPFIDDDGQRVADSFFIGEYLKEKYQIDFDAWLGDEQKAIAHLIIKSLEENFYFCIVYSRWVPEQTWIEFKRHVFAKLPIMLKPIVPKIARKQVLSTLNKQGISRHNEQQVLAIFDHSLRHLSNLLGRQRYFMGGQICQLDIVAYAMLIQVAQSEMTSKFSTQLDQYPNLLDFCHRFELLLEQKQQAAA